MSFRFLVVALGASFSTLACSAGYADKDASGTGGSGATTGDATGSATGAIGTGGTGTGTSTGALIEITPGSYALPPPDQCVNTYHAEGCVKGDASSTCGGVCEPKSAGHSEDAKDGEWGYMCPRAMLYSGEMEQAAKDDAKTYGWSDGASSPFVYGVAGHDFNSDIDGPSSSICCQCYQLVPYLPHSDPQVTENGDGTTLLVEPPGPMVVQAFNTGATTDSFDIYMAAGGFGAFDACTATTGTAPALYSSYPTAGQPNAGGVKAAGSAADGTDCKDQINLVRTSTLDSAGCTGWVEEQCNQIEHSDPNITASARRSCIQANSSGSLYHLNWSVYARRVACPAGLTQVTGCKLIEELPAVDPAITTPEQAQAAGFKTGYHLTTMEDCAKPTCAARDKIIGQDVQSPAATDGNYNSFYTCNAQGVPFTQAE